MANGRRVWRRLTETGVTKCVLSGPRPVCGPPDLPDLPGPLFCSHDWSWSVRVCEDWLSSSRAAHAAESSCTGDRLWQT